MRPSMFCTYLRTYIRRIAVWLLGTLIYIHTHSYIHTYIRVQPSGVMDMRSKRQEGCMIGRLSVFILSSVLVVVVSQVKLISHQIKPHMELC